MSPSSHSCLEASSCVPKPCPKGHSEAWLCARPVWSTWQWDPSSSNPASPCPHSLSPVSSGQKLLGPIKGSSCTRQGEAHLLFQHLKAGDTEFQVCLGYMAKFLRNTDRQNSRSFQQGLGPQSADRGLAHAPPPLTALKT